MCLLDSYSVACIVFENCEPDRQRYALRTLAHNLAVAIRDAMLGIDIAPDWILFETALHSGRSIMRVNAP